MNGPSPILLAKLAHDAGFVVELGEADGWLAFAIPGFTEVVAVRAVRGLRVLSDLAPDPCASWL